MSLNLYNEFFKEIHIVDSKKVDAEKLSSEIVEILDDIRIKGEEW